MIGGGGGVRISGPKVGIGRVQGEHTFREIQQEGQRDGLGLECGLGTASGV